MALPSELGSEEIDALEAAAPYRALCPQAVLSVVLGAASIVTAFSWYLAMVPILGLWLGWRALRQIRDASDQWTGMGLAKVGMSLSIGLWVLGSGWHWYDVHRIPSGYQFLQWDVLQPDPNAPAEPIPQTALDLQDHRIFVKGYMRPRRQQSGIKEFVISPNSGECPFCVPNPKPTQMIRVVLQGDLQTFFTTNLVGVGGRFQVDPHDPDGMPYTLEADCLR